ncbi:hypothetical protein PF004_g10455 [Phytophthora fragariae]|nr:hypothetical protein PR002_g13487 [Phytophthora rubi]KAE9230581.1 hypothetical protein PF004_g10455 [Phytophthora fragariae]
MTRVLYRKLLADKVLTAIRTKLPVRRGTTVFVQQDNAGPHVREDETAENVDGWKIKMRCQPPRSPELNVLDLDFFASI